jgi:hypothetical protein
MKAYEYILSKQIEYAHNKGIDLIKSKGSRGRPTYTRSLEDNLFEPLTTDTKTFFQNGDGGELGGDPSKMQAVHSSSALAVNVFQYWDNIKEVEKIAHACGFCHSATRISKGISFEVKYSIDEKFQYSPNVDVVINNEPGSKHKVFAVESKFTEPYSNWEHLGFKAKYLDLDIWEEISHLYKLASSISPKDERFHHLHAAQLIKHILGLKRAFGKTNFRLLYLWYDALGREGAKHREEIHGFLEVAKSDDIAIHELSYQELFARLADNYRISDKKYIEYITSRYL